MNKKRIYGEKVNINSDNTKDFYNNRARSIQNMDNLYVSMLLGDQNPEYALAWDSYEKENILPKMQIDEHNKILDIWCGMGHWAESLIPISGYYCGTDLSPEMVKCAAERNHFPERSMIFYIMDSRNFVHCRNRSCPADLTGYGSAEL